MDRYTVSSRLLGSGVYGTVYLARDEVTQKQLACKVVNLRGDALKLSNPSTPQDDGVYAEKSRKLGDARKKLIREIEILSKLSHVRVN